MLDGLAVGLALLTFLVVHLVLKGCEKL